MTVNIEREKAKRKIIALLNKTVDNPMTNHPNRSKIKNWPEYLKQFRASHGLTQVKLADLLGVAASLVEQWEMGRFTPPAYLKLALQQVGHRLQKSLAQSAGE